MVMVKTFNELYPPGNEPSGSATSWWRRILRIGYDATKGFIEDDCYSKASALTFYSLLSIVPVLAVLFGIAKGFGFEAALEKEIVDKFHEQEEVVNKLIEFAYSWLQNVQGGVIAGVGTIVLLYSVFSLMSNIEAALNGIWKITNSRPYIRKVSDYLATMVICPIFFVTSSSITLYLTQFATSPHESIIISAISPAVLLLLKFFPYLLSWGLFTFIYLFMPNTKVYLRSALIAGVVAGTAFQLWQWIYIKFMIGIASYGAIYGSFAALPLFLMWLQISWLIMLAGAEIAFEIENDLFIPFRKPVIISSKAAALLITHRCVESFVKGGEPVTDRSLAHELGISINHLHSILEALQSQHILSAVSYQGKTVGYQPAKAINTLTMVSVCQAIDRCSDLYASVEDSSTLRSINDFLDSQDKLTDEWHDNQPIHSLLQ
jgi:membrane protein